MPAAPEKVLQVASKPVNEDEDYLYLFYPETDTARQAGLESLRRLDTRLARSHVAVSLQATQSQLAAIRSFGAGVWDQLEQLTLPVLVGNGARDIMISAFASYAMSQRLLQAKVILYSDAGHAFLFQHAEEFGHEVLRFLR
jgi:pimeloyl-ACP methyl ester carboxylesterase